MQDNVQEWLTSLLKGILNHPENLEVEKSTDELGVLFTVRVHEQDRGIIVGREGITARSIRVLLRSIGMKNRMKANLRIDIPDRPGFAKQEY